MTLQQTSTGDKAPVWIAVYTRKSNDENLTGEVTSLDSQKAACRAYINIQKEKGWREYPEAFDDPAESGKSLKRPAMKRLLQSIQEGKVNGVIVYKLDRLTRNSRDFHMLIELFEERNVAFVSATESIDTKSPQGRLMTAIMVQFAQYDREMDVERSKDFHLARARKGLWCAGLPPLGYDLKDKLLVVNEEEAQSVRRVFDLYFTHKSTFRVADDLNRQGFLRKTYRTKDGKTFGGKPFDPDTVTRILQRKIYIGLITNERTGQEFPGQHQPIVSPEVFETAQKLLASHNKREGELFYGVNKHGFLLKGLIRCGECRSAVVGYIQPQKKKTYRYYKCLAKVNGLPIRCHFTSIGAQKLEEYLIEKLAAVGYDRPLLEKVVHKVKMLVQEHLPPMEAERREIMGRLEIIRQEIRNLIGMAKGQGASSEATRELHKLEAVQRELEARVGELDARIGYRKRAVYDVDVIQGALQRFARFVYKMPLDQRIRTIRLLVRQVTVFKDRLRAELHELPIADLQRALDLKLAPGDLSKLSNPAVCPRREQTTNGKANGQGTGLMELRQNWRGRQGQSRKILIAQPVPKAEETHFIPSFDLTWTLEWGRITNGELVAIDALCAPTPSIPSLHAGHFSES